jgi:hypothetical protein
VSVAAAIATFLTVASILSFAGYLAALVGEPSSGRPETPVYSRFGEELPPQKNPGFKETEEETH